MVDIGRLIDPPVRVVAGAQDAVAAVARPVEELLAGFLATRSRAISAIDPVLAELTDAIGDLVGAGGKRLRPAFVHWGHRAAGCDPDDAVRYPAAAVELLHTFALLHDDVMDRSAVRRGRPTAHVSLADRHRSGGGRGDAGWFGTSGAILAGDLVYVWADELLHRTPVPVAALQRRAGCSRPSARR